MLLAVDIGNSSIGFGLFAGDGTLRMKSKIASEQARSAEEYAVLLLGILQLHGLQREDVTDCILSSVVPLLTNPVRSAVERLFGVRPLEVGAGIRTGLDIKIDSQTQLGADIVANAVGALALYDAPIVIVDVGTATTFTVIDEKKVLQGVVISPGLRMSMDALSAGASQLPDAPIILPKRLVGKNSGESMNIGVLYGHAFLIDGFLNRLHTEKQTAVLTGGLAETVLPLCQSRMRHEPDLTLRGLRFLYLKNRK